MLVVGRRVLGKIEHQAKPRRSWVITCEPHVAMKIRRLFVGEKRGTGNEVILADSDANAHEIEWVRQRYPLELVGEAVERFPAAVARYRERVDRIEEMHAPDYKPPEVTLALPPREYQRFGAEMAARSGGLLLADDVGLGKTVTAIAALVSHGTFPAVVVTLTHLCRQWEREFHKFAPELSVHVANASRSYPLDSVVLTRRIGGRRKVVGGRGEPATIPDVLIMNYHKLAGWADELIRVGFKAVVWDECQELRRSEAKKWDAGRAIAEASVMRLGLSATPIYNYGIEIFNVLECIAPELLGDRTEFVKEWCSYSAIESKARVNDPAALRTHLLESGAMLRRTRKDVGRELPDLSRIWHTVEADKGLDDVGGDVTELARFIVAQQGDRFERMRAAGDLDAKLRLATGMSKARSVAAFVRMLVETGERVLLYGWHHVVYDVWRKELADLGFAEYHGAISVPAKEQAIARFRSGDAKVLAMSLRAGAGVDGLQHVCRTVVVGELDWSPGVHIQGEGRVHRDGQQDPVTAFYLVADDGSDPVVQDVLGLKETQRSGLVDGQQEASAIGATDQAADDQRMLRLAREFLRRRGVAA